jgi:hypothetical protein
VVRPVAVVGRDEVKGERKGYEEGDSEGASCAKDVGNHGAEFE